jgi:hypothetical protein
MPALLKLAAAVAAAAALAGCDVTLPWSGKAGPGGGAPSGSSLDVSTSSLTFTATAGGLTPPSQSIQLISTGTVYLSVTYSGPVASATVDKTTGTVQVSVGAPTSAGTTTGAVLIHAYADAAGTQEIAGSPRSVSVTYTVSASAPGSQLAVAPATMSFTAAAGAGPSPAQTLTLSDPNGTAPWSTSVTYVGSTTGWLSVSPSSGTGLPATPSVTVSFPAATAATTYSATLKVTSGGVTRSVSVTATVSSPRTLAPSGTLNFAAIRDQVPLPASQSLDLTTEDGASRTYTTQVTYGTGASGWLVVPASGTAPGTLAASVSTDGLTPGHYTATLRISPANGATATTVQVAYDIAAPALTVGGGPLTYTVDATTTLPQTQQTLTLGDGGAALSWTASASQPWLAVTPSGSTPASPTVSLVIPALETLAPGSQSATVTFTYTTAGGASVPVTLSASLALSLPIIDTVMPRASVTGVGGEVVLRGHGFPAMPSSGPLYGVTSSTAPTAVSATELRSVPPTTLTAGSYLVTFPNALGLLRSTARLEVVDARTRTAASVASAGTKARIIHDDVRQALYVANAGAGRIDRYRAAAGWAKAADGSDEIALAGVKNLALSPDGATLLAIAGTSFRLVDAATFTLRATQPTALAPSAAQVGLEMTNLGQAVYLALGPTFNAPGVFDLATGTAGPVSGAVSVYGGALAGSANGSQVTLGSYGLSPPQAVSWFDAGTGAVKTTPSTADVKLCALDRTARRLVTFGAYNSFLGRRESRYFQGYAVVNDGGTLPPEYVITPPASAPPATLTFALSPLGNARAYTWDGTAVRCYDLDGTPDATFGVYPLLFSVTPVAAPGANAQLTVAADEKAAFLAGDSAVVIVPLP